MIGTLRGPSDVGLHGMREAQAAVLLYGCQLLCICADAHCRAWVADTCDSLLQM